MTIFPYRIHEMLSLYNGQRASNAKPSPAAETDQGEAQDIIEISAEAKKRQILEQAKADVPDRIRSAK